MDENVTTGSATLSQRVAEEIRAWMGRRRVSGAEMARRLSVSPAWVSYRLTGTQPIDLNDLERIADILDVDVAELIPRRVGAGALNATGTQEGPPRRGINVFSGGRPERPHQHSHPNHHTPRDASRRPARISHKTTR